ncbi:hypothetical protein M231_07617 [Tremella mesenterica]|uniref:Uncharacterized protein n=1 Tax=Tremella mesenterica TaxID=5217 RepID=A0A4Q1BBT3_TREME|nr:hypothetical protein M231_07617 [Tremella mesenterica]
MLSVRTTAANERNDPPADHGTLVTLMGPAHETTRFFYPNERAEKAFIEETDGKSATSETRWRLDHKGGPIECQLFCTVMLTHTLTGRPTHVTASTYGSIQISGSPISGNQVLDEPPNDWADVDTELENEEELRSAVRNAVAEDPSQAPVGLIDTGMVIEPEISLASAHGGKASFLLPECPGTNASLLSEDEYWRYEGTSPGPVWSVEPQRYQQLIGELSAGIQSKFEQSTGNRRVYNIKAMIDFPPPSDTTSSAEEGSIPYITDLTLVERTIFHQLAEVLLVVHYHIDRPSFQTSVESLKILLESSEGVTNNETGFVTDLMPQL